MLHDHVITGFNLMIMWLLGLLYNYIVCDYSGPSISWSWDYWV